MNIEIEEQRYGRNKNTKIDHTYIESGAFRRKFDKISNTKDLNRLLYQLAKKILYHRAGTLYEDMYWIDPKTCKVVAEKTDSTTESEILYDASVKRTIETYENLITIHSHPNSTPPSYNDLRSNYENGYSLGVIVCHSGTVYMYATEEEISEGYYRMSVGDLIKEGFSENEAFLMTLQRLQDNKRILFKEVTGDDS